MTRICYEYLLSLTDAVSMNDRHIHWAPRAKATARLRTDGRWLARAHAHGNRFDRARLVVTVSWPDGRRRDAANLHPSVKALVDGAVDECLIPDDDDTHLVGPDLRTSLSRSGVPGHARLVMVWSDEDDQ
jgi:hypothetical protein